MITANEAKEKTIEVIKVNAESHAELKSIIDNHIMNAIQSGNFSVVIMMDLPPKTVIQYYQAMGYKMYISKECGFVEITWSDFV
jgi:hypothetical protein